MNHLSLTVHALAILSWALSSSALAQESQRPGSRFAESPNSSRDAEELNAIRRGSKAFSDAFNRADAKAVARLWTPDGDYIDEADRRFHGRDAIEKEYADFFQENRGVKIRIVIDTLRLITNDAAIEDGRAILDPATAGAPATTKYTAVHAKVDGQWLMSTVRDIRVEQPSHARLADLEWLIGIWTAEEHGAKSRSVCCWIANKSFVERTYTTIQPDGTVSSGVQIIGWDAENGRVQSWSFTSDGGHALGIWTPQDRGWSTEIRGVMGDGTPTAAVNVLTRLDDNAYSWQSIKRTAGGRSIPDTDEIVLKRRQASELEPRRPQNTTRTAETRP